MAATYGAIHSLLPDSAFLAGFAGLVSLLAATAILNILRQLFFPAPKTQPPVVFHVFPIIGNAVTYGMDPYKFLFEARAKHGDIFTFILLGRKMTVALGPAGNNMIFNGKLSHVNAEEAYTHLTTPVFGTDVVYDCPNHLLMEQKKFMKIGLSTEAFRAYIPLIRNEVISYFADRVFGSKTTTGPAKDSSTVDAVEASGQLTIFTAAITLQGKEVRQALDTTFAALYHDLDGGFTPINFIFPNLPLPSYRRRDVAHIKMREFYMGIMRQRRLYGSSNDEDGHDILQSLQGATYKDGRMCTDKEIAHMMIALLMAGQHTSSATVSWLVLHLGEKPELQELLYQEQVAIYGKPDGTLAPLDYDKLQSPFVNACVREVLRIHPPLHSIIRKVIADLPVTHLEGRQYVVPKGFYLLAAPGVIQVDPHYWKDPNVYEPRRWIGETTEVSKQLAADMEGEKQDFGWGAIATGASSPYIPFGAGRHRCIGEQFAHVQVGTILATLVREFKWTLPAGKVPDQDYTTMIVMPKNPRQITFTRRDKVEIS